MKPSLRVRVAASAGFCPGVERALQLTLDAVENARTPIHTLGPLIHNPSVISDLQSQGVGVIDEPSLELKGTLILRSHGVPRHVRDRLQTLAVEVVDATCPFVTSAQEKAARLAENGYSVIVLGDRDHPEVLALKSYAGADAIVVETASELPERFSAKRIGVVVQTTQSKERLAELVARLAPLTKELLVHNTICNATELRQSAALEMAADVDVVVVVGGRQSGNTRRLAELCAQRQPNTHHVESASELDPEWFAGHESVGVTAGASTPSDQIASVVRALEGMVV